MNTNANPLPETTNGVSPVVVIPTNEPSLTMDKSETAAFIGISRSTIYKLCAKGAMPRPNSLNRFNRAEIEKWVADGCPDLRAKARARR